MGKLGMKKKKKQEQGKEQYLGQTISENHFLSLNIQTKNKK
jgi:hypothetical protein